MAARNNDSSKRRGRPKRPLGSEKRPVWKGRLTFGLVGIPVALVPAVDSREHMGFHLLHRKDLAPIRYRKFCSLENVEVGEDEIVRGHETGRGKWAVVGKEELADVREKAAAGSEADVLEVLSFVPPDALDPVALSHAYYLEPGEGGRKSFAVLRAALADSGTRGLARLRLRSRVHLAVIVPLPRTLALVILRPFEEIFAPATAPAPSPTSQEIKMAKLLIEEMTEETLDPARYPDRYRAILGKLLASKTDIAGGVASKERRLADAPEGRVLDLMSALKASVAARGTRAKRRHIA